MQTQANMNTTDQRKCHSCGKMRHTLTDFSNGKATCNSCVPRKRKQANSKRALVANLQQHNSQLQNDCMQLMAQNANHTSMNALYLQQIQKLTAQLNGLAAESSQDLPHTVSHVIIDVDDDQHVKQCLEDKQRSLSDEFWQHLDEEDTDYDSDEPVKFHQTSSAQFDEDWERLIRLESNEWDKTMEVAMDLCDAGGPEFELDTQNKKRRKSTSDNSTGTPAEFTRQVACLE